MKYPFQTSGRNKTVDMIPPFVLLFEVEEVPKMTSTAEIRKLAWQYIKAFKREQLIREIKESNARAKAAAAVSYR
jgi:hypothetical protein